MGHGVLELEPVLSLVDGLRAGADQFDLVFVEHPLVPEVKRAVQGSLATHGRQNRVRPLFGDDFFDCLPGDGLDISHIGRRRVRHDGGRIAVDQDDLVTLLTQRLAGLYARVVKLTGLADDDRARTNDQNTFDIATLWHVLSCCLFVDGSASRRCSELDPTGLSARLSPSWRWPASHQTRQTRRPPHWTEWQTTYPARENHRPGARP